MTIAVSSAAPIAADTRRWAAALCTAADADAARQVLGSAFLDLGFEAVSALRPDPAGGVAVGWSMLGGETESDADPLVEARRAVLYRLDPQVHRWVARQQELICQDDFLALDEAIYTEFLNLPADFGQTPWRTKLSVPYRGDGRGITIGLASVESFERHRERLPAVRFLAELYCRLQAQESFGGDDEAAEAPALSLQQIACLRWAAAGKTYPDIAEILGISPRTVRFHLENARQHYGFATVTQTLVQAAKDLDLDPLDAR